MSEFATAIRLGMGGFPACVQQVNYPVHKGKPNPAHGKFYVVGSVPAACVKVYFESEDACIAALRAAGAERIQRTDCTFVQGGAA